MVVLTVVSRLHPDSGTLSWEMAVLSKLTPGRNAPHICAISIRRIHRICFTIRFTTTSSLPEAQSCTDPTMANQYYVVLHHQRSQQPRF
jgi:hypothetical protein